jgi:hypothetical protein
VRVKMSKVKERRRISSQTGVSGRAIAVSRIRDATDDDEQPRASEGVELGMVSRAHNTSTMRVL